MRLPRPGLVIVALAWTTLGYNLGHGQKSDIPVKPKTASPSAEVKLDLVKHKDFLEAIKAQKGKIVVIDFWGDFCIPCKEEFPNLVEIHKKHAKDGVVCISVSVDDTDDRDKALKFLKAKGATFPNYILDEPVKTWQDHWNLYGPPAVFVYDRQGKQAGRFDHNDPNKQYTYQDVKNLVKKLLSPQS